MCYGKLVPVQYGCGLCKVFYWGKKVPYCTCHCFQEQVILEGLSMGLHDRLLDDKMGGLGSLLGVSRRKGQGEIRHLGIHRWVQTNVIMDQGYLEAIPFQYGLAF